MPIDKVEIYITDLPNRLQRTFYSGSWDTGPSGSSMGKPVLVKIHADGATGYGQIRPISPGHFIPDTVMSVVAAIRDIYGPLLIGQSPFNMASILESFDKRLPLNMNARAAVDHALHDLTGKLLGVPAYDLMGGAVRRVLPLEWSVSLAADPQTMVEEAVRAVEEFQVPIVGLKAGGQGGWQRDIENFLLVREAIGQEVEMGVDPNTGWSVSEAIRAVRAMSEYDIAFVEQPVHRADLVGLRRIRDAIDGVTLLADESLVTLQDAYRLALEQAVDAFVIKLYKVGGLFAARKISAVAEAANLQLNVGGLAAFSQLEAAAGAHFLATQPIARVTGGAEFLFGLGAIGPDPIAPEASLKMVGGHVVLPDASGLGVVVDDEAVERLALHHEVVLER